MLEAIEAKQYGELEQFANIAPEGLMLEFGVHTGETITRIANRTKRKIYGFDSFGGLPEDWRPGYGKGTFACDIPEVPDNVELVVGLFNDTLPKFVEDHKEEKVAFVHVDCDLYSSTKCVFDNLKHMFQDGTVICFDELINYYGYEEHEWKAWHEFLNETKYKWEVLGRYGGEQVGFIIYK